MEGNKERKAINHVIAIDSLIHKSPIDSVIRSISREEIVGISHPKMLQVLSETRFDGAAASRVRIF